jgi:WD40 repeat protein
LTSGLDGSVRFWDLATGQRKHTIDTIQKCVSFAMCQNETTIVTGLSDCIKVFDARTRALGFKIDDQHSSNVTCIKFTPDENYIVSTSSDSRVVIWDVRQ